MHRTRFALIAIAWSACAEVSAGDVSYAVNVRVTSDPDVGVAGVALRSDQTQLGVTREDGRAYVQLSGREGDRVAIAARCPDTHTAPEPAAVVLRSYIDRDTPELEIRCAPRRRKLAVVVAAKNGPSLPLVHHGMELARTDAQGVAHFVLESTPGDAFDVTLDTSSRTDLKPRNPYARFVIGTRDAAQLFDPELKIAPVVKRGPRPQRTELSNRPQRIR